MIRLGLSLPIVLISVLFATAQAAVRLPDARLLYERVVTKCGADYFAYRDTKPKPVVSAVTGDPLVELKGVKFKLVAGKPSDAARLDGVEWVGTAIIEAKFYRYWQWKQWTNWMEVSVGPPVDPISIHRVKDIWLFNFDDVLDESKWLTLDRIVKRRPACNDLPEQDRSKSR